MIFGFVVCNDNLQFKMYKNLFTKKLTFLLIKDTCLKKKEKTRATKTRIIKTIHEIKVARITIQNN